MFMKTRYKSLGFFLLNFLIIFNLNAMSKDDSVVEITNSAGQGNFSIVACSLFGNKKTLVEKLENNYRARFAVGKDCDLIRVAPEITFSFDDIDNGFGEPTTIKEAESILGLAFIPAKHYGAKTKINIVNVFDSKKRHDLKLYMQNSVFGLTRE